MKIVVCIKQVPDTNEVKLDPKTNTLIREGVPSIINPDDKAAIEEALNLKDRVGAEVVVLTMGPPQADYALREALAMGVDRAILLSSRVFAGADTWATSLTLAKAVESLQDYDLILCGRQAIDGDTAQVGPELAEHLDIPQITYVKNIDKVEKTKLVAERAMEHGYEVIECSLPAVLTFLKEANTPRLPSMHKVVDAFDHMEIECWDESRIDIHSDLLGLCGSPTQVCKTFSPDAKVPGIMVDGSNEKEKARTLVGALVDKNLV